MRMTSHLVLAFAPALLIASCDPFDLVEPQSNRPVPRHGEQHPSATDEVATSHSERDPRPVNERYPVAERTANPNQVISPYAPFNVIDVTGFNSGQLARDPTNNEIFRIP